MQKADMDQIVGAAGSMAVLGMFGYLMRNMTKTMMKDFQTPEKKYLPQAKMVTVECPVCGKEIEIPDYPRVTRSDALLIHIQSEHSYPEKPATLSPQTLMIEGGEPVPARYRHLTGWLDEPLPEYSLMTDLLPAVEVETGEKKIDAVMKQLKEGVEGIQDSHQFRLFLTTMSKFHDYSIGNMILILLQKREATRVAGFNTWKDLGRYVKKGEKGIAILAPVMPPRPTCSQCNAKIPKGARYCPKCGDAVSVDLGESPRFFRVVPGIPHINFK